MRYHEGPHPGIKTMPPALKSRFLNHWTTIEVPTTAVILISCAIKFPSFSLTLTDTGRLRNFFVWLKKKKFSFFPFFLLSSLLSKSAEDHVCIYTCVPLCLTVKVPLFRTLSTCGWQEEFNTSPTWNLPFWERFSRFIAVQLLNDVWLFATSWTAAHQASLSFTISRSLLKFMFTEVVMPSTHLILCHSLLLLPLILPQHQGIFQ